MTKVNEKELINLSLELRKDISEKIQNFWKNNEICSIEESFFINSVVISSLIAQITYGMFEKNIGLKVHETYIDEICSFAKEQLKDASVHFQTGIQ